VTFVAAQQGGGARAVDTPVHSLTLPLHTTNAHHTQKCLLDAAAAWVLDPDRRAFRAALALAPGGGHTAVEDALVLELRSRLAAAGLSDISAPLTQALRAWQPAASQTDGGAPGSARSLLLFPGLVAQAPRLEGLLQDGRVVWPALRRALAAGRGQHGLEAVLGGDRDDKPAGSVVLTGGCGLCRGRFVGRLTWSAQTTVASNLPICSSHEHPITLIARCTVDGCHVGSATCSRCCCCWCCCCCCWRSSA